MNIKFRNSNYFNTSQYSVYEIPMENVRRLEVVNNADNANDLVHIYIDPTPGIIAMFGSNPEDAWAWATVTLEKRQSYVLTLFGDEVVTDSKVFVQNFSVLATGGNINVIKGLNP